MKDDNKTKKQLIHELTELRSQNAALKKSMAGSISAEHAAEEARRYAVSIVETVREPLLVLDANLKIISANPNFYKIFKVTPDETIGSFIYDLGNKQWDIPILRELLEEILPKKETFDDFEVVHNFQDIGHKIMLLNARQIYRKDIGLKMILLAIEDITEHKRLENLLTESEDRYRHVFETASDGIVFLEKREGKITHANPTIKKMFGYSLKESIGKKLPDIGIFDIGDFQTTIQSLNDGGIICYSDVQVKTKSGQHLDTDIYLVDRGNSLQCNIRDIAQRKRAGEVLQKSEEQYRLLFQNLTIGFALHEIIVNDEGQPCDYRFLEVNPAFEQFTGLKAQDLIGRTVRDALPGTELYWIEKYGRVALTGDPVHFENYSAELCRYYDCLAYSPRRGQFAVLLSDVTDRKLADDKLRITQFAVDCATEPVAWVREDGRYQYVNDAYCRLLGYSRDEMLSLRLDDLDPTISAEDWPQYWREIKHRGIHVLETSHRSKDGTLIPLEIHDNYLAYEDKEFYVTFARDIRERMLFETKLKRQFDRLAALRAIDMAITASLDIRVTFSIFLEQVIANLCVDAADVLLLDSQSYDRLSFVAGRGFRTNALQHTNLAIGAGYAGRVAHERKAICIPNLQKEPQDLLKQSPQISREDFITYHAVPLIAKGHVKGVLEVFNRTLCEHDQEWLDFLDALAQQAAIAIDNAGLFDDLQKSNINLIQAYDRTLEGWSKALDLRDKETEGHSQRVTEMTLRLARQMGMTDSELLHARRGALLHDIGKMGIPDGILLKPGQLNDEEWEIMRKHPVYAYELLYPISYLRPVLDIPYCHHEKWDGTGYPRGLKGEYIPLAARIFAIVDVWDALCSARPYRPAWPEEKAREYIRDQSGKQFDPKVVEGFFELLKR